MGDVTADAEGVVILQVVNLLTTWAAARDSTAVVLVFCSTFSEIEFSEDEALDETFAGLSSGTCSKLTAPEEPASFFNAVVAPLDDSVLFPEKSIIEDGR